MRTLSKSACDEWLDERGIGRAYFYNQFRLPKEAAHCASIFRWIVESVEPFGVALLQFKDWDHHRSGEMAVIETLRQAHGDHRWLKVTPGHLFEYSERDLLIGIFSLAAFYGWTADLYFDHHMSCLCWEGELLVLWAPEKEWLRRAEEGFKAADLPP